MRPLDVFREISGTEPPDTEYIHTKQVHDHVKLTLESFFVRYDGLRVDIFLRDKHTRFMAMLEHKGGCIISSWYTPCTSFHGTDERNIVMEQLYDLQSMMHLPYRVLHFDGQLHVYSPNDKPLYITMRKLVHVDGYPASQILNNPVTQEMKARAGKRIIVDPSPISKRFLSSEIQRQEAAHFDFDKSVKSLPNIKEYIGDLL